MSDPPIYPPSDNFIGHAQVQGPDAYRDLREQAQADPNQFWSQLAAQELHWFQPFTRASNGTRLSPNGLPMADLSSFETEGHFVPHLRLIPHKPPVPASR
jgi:hypothetical protein